MRQLAALWLCLASGTACHGPAAAPPADVPSHIGKPTTVRLPPPTKPISLAPPDVMKSPRVLQAPSQSVCSLRTNQLLAKIWVLRLRPSGRPVLEVDPRGRGLEATLSLPALSLPALPPPALSLPVNSLHGGGFLKVRGPGGSLRGWVASADIHLRAAKPIVIADYLVPFGSAPLRYEQALPQGQLVVSMTPPKPVEAHPRAKQRLDCQALGIERRALEPGDALALGKNRHWGILRGDAIPLRVEPNAAPVARFRFGTGETGAVAVHETGKEFARIVYRGRRSLVFGWVPRASLILPGGSPPGRSWSSHRKRRAKRMSDFVRRRCTHPTALLVRDADAVPVIVGELPAGTVLRVSKSPSGSMRVVWPEYRSWFRAPRGGELLVRRSEIADCKAPPRPEP